MSLENVLARIDADLAQSTDRLFELLRIASISTDPAYDQECDAAADWLVSDLNSFGIRAEKHASPGHPFVVGHSDNGNNGDRGPHFLFYGHYDVQPVDPLELWQRDPFDPALEDGRGGKLIRGRGASDDKGQLMTFVEACRAWTAEHGSLPARITFFFEGEEESGSPSLQPFMRAHAENLRADLALICDTGLFGRSTPTIVTMLRGLLGQEIIITGADKDLHSGMFGGAAANPARILAQIIAGLHDAAGRVTLPGFYDGVDEPGAAQLAQWQALGFDHRPFLGDVGLSELAGETGRSALEMLWSRPTCEVNGITGGYTGDGFKTVLPAQASAKISFRLVGRQDPVKICAAFQKYVRAGLPADCDVEFVEHGMAPA
ncbi:MAG: M20/M25/M40 family metallo-hydrolase, partial [Paracoccaceae bacterium]